MAEVKKIMVAVDESEFSHYALEWTLDNLQLHGDGKNVSLFIMHVYPYPTMTSAGGVGVSPGSMGLTSPELIDALMKQQKQMSEALLARAKEMCAKKNVTVETMSEMGDPKDIICDAVEKMQIGLLVVGNHGYGMVKRAFIGSVSSHCVHYAKCPVLVVRKPS